MIAGSILMARALVPVEQGLITAQFNLGVLYSRIDVKLKSQTKSTEWYVLAAEAGHATARYNLAQRFENGRGDRARLRRGAALGDPRVGDGQRTA